MMIQDKETLRTEIRAAMRKTEALDLWTNLPVDPMAHDACHGIDALLTANKSLLSQARALGVALPDESNEQAQALFHTLFTERPPLSGAAMRVLLSLERMGMHLGTRDMSAIGERIGEKSPEERMEWILELANLKSVACVLDPFTVGANGLLEKHAKGALSPKLLPALTVEALQNALAHETPLHSPEGELEYDRHGTHLFKIAEQLVKWSSHFKARFVRASWPREALVQDMLMRFAVLPVCEEHGMPLAMELSDCEAELEKQFAWVWEALRRSAGLRFVLAARGGRTAEALLARKAQPMGERIFPVLATEKCMARKALDAAGTAAMPFASGAGVLEQTIGDWVEARREISQAMYDRYLPLVKMGWAIHKEEIETDTDFLLGGNWENFSKRM